jgi:tetratricopeptide (TPR) repeat protein
MRRSGPGLFCILCFLVCAIPARGQLGSGGGLSASGTVFADGGTRLQDVIVRLCDAGGRLIIESSTNSSGEFRFNGLAPAHYTLQFQSSGFQNAESQVDLTFSSQNGLAFYLKPSPQTASNAASVSVRDLSISDNARALYASGKKKLYDEKKPREALTDFQSALSAAPDFYEARYQIGMTYLSLGQTQDAEASFRDCITKSRDKFGNANIALGTLLIDRGNSSEGEKQIRHGLAINPSAWMGYFQLAKLQAQRNELDDAEKSAELAQQYAPGTAMVYQLLANIHMRQKNYLAMLQDIDAFLRIEPDSPAGKRAKELRAEIEKQIEVNAAR